MQQRLGFPSVVINNYNYNYNYTHYNYITPRYYPLQATRSRSPLLLYPRFSPRNQLHSQLPTPLRLP